MKIKILDTNIILEDPEEAIKAFKPKNNEETEVYIPFSVMAELERFKKEKSERGANSRRFFQTLNKYMITGDLNQGIKIRENYTIKTDYGVEREQLPEKVKRVFSSQADEDIVNLAYTLKRKEKEVEVITQDTTVQLICKALGIESSEWRDKTVLRDIKQAYKGWRVIPYNPEITEKLKKGDINIEEIDELMENIPSPNEYIIFDIKKPSPTRPDGMEARRYDAKLEKLVRLYHYENKKTRLYAKNIRQKCLMDALRNPEITAVFIIGSPGTGKTLLSIDAIVEQGPSLVDSIIETKNKKKRKNNMKETIYEQLIITRPARGDEGEDIGYLPGTIEEKFKPYLEPIVQNWIKAISANSRYTDINDKEIAREAWETNKENGLIQIVPLFFMRGITPDNTYIIADEMQNTTRNMGRLVLTRAGEGTKVVFTGDLNQIDVGRGVTQTNNALITASQTHKSDETAATIYFTDEDIVRSPRAKKSEELMR